MYKLFDEMLSVMDAAYRDFEAAVPAPLLVETEVGWVYRYEDQNSLQAIIQKLVLVQSGLRAAHILLRNGHIYEQAMLERVVDEANEDILFLVFAITNNNLTPLHERYLTAFWQEEFSDHSDPLGSEQKRDMVPRKRIRAYLASMEGKRNDPSGSIELAKTISKTLSGFVHGASPQLMELFGEGKERFHTKGMLGTPKIEEYTDDLWNYMYRGFLSHVFAANVFSSKQYVDRLIEHKRRFEGVAGKNYD